MSKKQETERQSNFFDVCGQCKISCCRGARPPTTPTRRKLIEEHLTRNPLKGVDPPYFVKDNNYTHPRETLEGFCIFYDKKTRLCRIHTIKPETCVAGPITFDVNPKTKKLKYFLKMEKICPLAGKIHKLDGQNLERHLSSAKTEIRRLLADIEPEALRAILKIEEPDTFKIYEEENDNARKKLATECT